MVVWVAFMYIQLVAFWIRVDPSPDFALQSHKAALLFDYDGFELSFDFLECRKQSFDYINKFLNFQNTLDFL